MPRKLTTAKFIEKANSTHDYQYRYDQVKYVDSKTKVLIGCPKHGSFYQQPNGHLLGQGCPLCGRIKCDNNRKISQEDFIDRATQKHKGKYKYTKTHYIRNNLKVTITCPTHGDFAQIAYDHLRGRGCQKCAKTKYSTIAIEWLDKISHQRGISIQHAGNDREFLIPDSKYRADGYCEETNTIYEFYGDKWHGNPVIYEANEKCNPFNDMTAGELYQKTVEREHFIRQKGYNLETVWESEYLKGIKT